MESNYKSKNFMIGRLHIVIYNKWQGIEYKNATGALGWDLVLGYISFWGIKD